MQTTWEIVPEEASDLAQFLQVLETEGRAIVTQSPPDPPDEQTKATLVGMESTARAELAGDPPEFSVEAAGWAAQLLYQLTRLILCRDLGEREVQQACSVPCPCPRGPQTDYSVDITLRHLPRLLKLARHLSNADPLVEQMNRIASEWPLSSVGVSGLKDLSIDSFIDHPVLRRLYADRVAAADDTSRLGDARLDELLRCDLGLHSRLAPSLASRLAETNS